MSISSDFLSVVGRVPTDWQDGGGRRAKPDRALYSAQCIHDANDVNMRRTVWSLVTNHETPEKYWRDLILW